MSEPFYLEPLEPKKIEQRALSVEGKILIAEYCIKNGINVLKFLSDRTPDSLIVALQKKGFIADHDRVMKTARAMQKAPPWYTGISAGLRGEHVEWEREVKAEEERQARKKANGGINPSKDMERVYQFNEKDPSTNHSPEYSNYINSEEWRGIRWEFLTAADWKCQVCGEKHFVGSSSLEAHHAWYAEKGESVFGREIELRCLWAVCAGDCHALADYVRGVRRGREVDCMSKTLFPLDEL